MLDTRKDEQHLTEYQIGFPVASILQELAISMSINKPIGDIPDSPHQIRECCKIGIDEISGWIEALGYLTWLATTHDEQSNNTTRTIGTVGLLIRSLTQLMEGLNAVGYEALVITKGEKSTLISDAKGIVDHE